MLNGNRNQQSTTYTWKQLICVCAQLWNTIQHWNISVGHNRTFYPPDSHHSLDTAGWTEWKREIVKHGRVDSVDCVLDRSAEDQESKVIEKVEIGWISIVQQGCPPFLLHSRLIILKGHGGEWRATIDSAHRIYSILCLTTTQKPSSWRQICNEIRKCILLTLTVDGLEHFSNCRLLSGIINH